ncbi:hypothetical protein [Streptomyces sp. NPDC002587]
MTEKVEKVEKVEKTEAVVAGSGYADASSRHPSGRRPTQLAGSTP